MFTRPSGFFQKPPFSINFSCKKVALFTRMSRRPLLSSLIVSGICQSRGGGESSDQVRRRGEPSCWSDRQGGSNTGAHFGGIEIVVLLVGQPLRTHVNEQAEERRRIERGTTEQLGAVR